MKKSRVLKIGAVFATAFCLANAGWLIAQSQTQPSRSQKSSTRQYDSSASTSSSSSQVLKVNRASQLIGMSVKNQQDEKLGKIDDVVIDFNGERVGYVVLNINNGMLNSQKLVAVPLNAFRPGTDGDHLILNADKDKLARAEGFDKDHWPAPSNPSWGAEPFWQDSSGNSSERITPSPTDGSK